MKFKRDENLGHEAGAPLRRAGHDVATVQGQSLAGSADVDLIAICKAEDRCLVTLDLEFGNPLLFDPVAYAGIAVLRPGKQQGADELRATLATLAEGLAENSIDGRLWVVQPGRIRIYQDQ